MSTLAGDPPKAARSPSALRNRLLAALSFADYSRLAQSLESVHFPLKHFLHRPGDTVNHVHFAGGGFFSELAVLANGEMVEVATIGREGMSGLFGALAGGRASSATMVQADLGSCDRLSAEIFRREMSHHGGFYELITRYSLAHLGGVMQGTACNAIHSLDQRLARWLLMAHDRVGADVFPLTQEFAAMMLGVSRPTVTIVAGTLQKAGIITYRRGMLTIKDRAALEQASCECYRVSTRLLDDVSQPRLSSRR